MVRLTGDQLELVSVFGVLSEELVRHLHQGTGLGFRPEDVGPVASLGFVFLIGQSTVSYLIGGAHDLFGCMASVATACLACIKATGQFGE